MTKSPEMGQENVPAKARHAGRRMRERKSKPTIMSCEINPCPLLIYVSKATSAPEWSKTDPIWCVLAVNLAEYTDITFPEREKASKPFSVQ